MWRGEGIEEERDLWNGCGEEGEQRGRKWEEKRGCGWEWFGGGVLQWDGMRVVLFAIILCISV